MRRVIKNKCYCSLLSFTLFALSSVAYPLSIKNLKTQGELRFGGDYVDNLQVEARVFGVTGLLGVEGKLNQDLSVKVKAGATLEVGSNNSFIINEYAPRQQWRLRDAHFSYKPFEFFKVSAGAINQRGYNSPLLMTSSAWLSAQERFNLLLSERFELFFRAQQAIPNNLNLTQRIGIVEDDGTPSFFMQSVGLNLLSDLLSASLELGKWGFDNQSTQSAFQSQFLGNSIGGGSPNDSEFLYKYSGYNLSAKLGFTPSQSFGIELKAQYLYNDKAPEKRNRGFFTRGTLILSEWRPSLLLFKNESDSSVGFYNSAIFSHNNHEGYGIGLDYHAPKGEIKASIDYIDSSPIQFNNFQSDTEKVRFSISLPVSY